MEYLYRQLSYTTDQDYEAFLVSGAAEIREALAALESPERPEGVPEFVYIGRSIAKDLGKKYVVVTTNIGTSAKLDAIKYRFDGVVSPEKEGEGK